MSANLVIDLTQPIEEQMPVSIGFPRVMLNRYFDRTKAAQMIRDKLGVEQAVVPGA